MLCCVPQNVKSKNIFVIFFLWCSKSCHARIDHVLVVLVLVLLNWITSVRSKITDYFLSEICFHVL